MGKVTDALSELVSNIVAFIVLIVMAIVAFYFTVFGVAVGRRRHHRRQRVARWVPQPTHDDGDRAGRHR